MGGDSGSGCGGVFELLSHFSVIQEAYESDCECERSVSACDSVDSCLSVTSECHIAYHVASSFQSLSGRPHHYATALVEVGVMCLFMDA